VLHDVGDVGQVRRQPEELIVMLLVNDFPVSILDAGDLLAATLRLVKAAVMDLVVEITT
jgi:hypothetical protein